MTADNASPPPPEDAAARLRAAVKAVESGERPAASFFAEPARPAARPARAAAPGPGARPGPAAVPAPTPVPVPEGLPALLAAGGTPEGLAGAVAAALGEAAEQELRDDPWRLLAVPGVRPDAADGFARATLGAEAGPGDERRTRALTVWLLERAALAGHTAVAAATVAKGLAAQAVPEPDEAVRDAVESGAVLVFRDAAPPPPGATGTPRGEDGEEDVPVTLLLGLDRYALAEESLADGLSRLRGTFEPLAEEAAVAWETAAGGAPSPSAAELLRAVAAHPVVVHTGGAAARAEPAALVAAARSLGLRACAAAHTADGRRGLAALLPGGAADAAVTVAGLLSGEEGPGRDGEGLLPLDLLAVLDAAQLSAEAAASLVEALPDGARLVLSGDQALLGPAGPGQVLDDVLGADFGPRVASRTPDEGPVGELVSGVGVGELLQPEAPGKEVVVVPVRDPGEAVHRTVQLVADSIPRAFGRSVAEIQVITPGHAGPVGTRALNAALKERLNPGPGRFGGFDPGDRVAHSPAPGRTRTATVASADAEGLWLEDADGRFVVAPAQVADTVRHGWALTAHQAVGSRWPAAVVVLPGDAEGTVDRSWVYTAFSRGEGHLSVVQGSGPGLAAVVTGPPAPPRTTRLRTLLREQLAASAPAGA
ncbi:helix-hairpin-helix domain-containing protein [Streptomyces avicenniae]|uniref:helix-hairpin-helix domain-containing protein n=1 Tax=Streptomyces avicenniae TaxID=500153 RepID=UPI00069AAAD7|nr:helix-hairpin-helix domain-containing protein [Streptomyces avicenniae]